MINTNISLDQMLQAESIYGSSALEYFEDVKSNERSSLQKDFNDAERCYSAAEKIYSSDPTQAISKYQAAARGFRKVYRTYEVVEKKKWGNRIIGGILGNLAGTSVAGFVGRRVTNKAVANMDQAINNNDFEKAADVTNKTVKKMIGIGTAGSVAGTTAGVMLMNASMKQKIEKTFQYLLKRIESCNEAIKELGGKEVSTDSYTAVVPNLSPLAQKIYMKALEEVEETLDTAELQEDSFDIDEDSFDDAIEALFR